MELSTLFAIFVVTLILYIYFENFHTNKPPGPLRFPLIGSLWKIAGKSHVQHENFQKLSEEYGPLCSMQLGLYDGVIFDDFDTIKRLLNHELWVDRFWNEVFATRSYGKSLGIIFISGDTWKEMRRFTMRTLRDFGFGKQKSMESMLEDEIKDLVHSIENSLKSSPIIDMKYLFSVPVLNVLWKMVCSVRSDEDDEKLRKLLVLVDKLSRATPMGGGILVPFPFLLKVPFLPNFTSHATISNINNELHQYFNDVLLKRREEGGYKTEQRDYIDVFLREIDNHKKAGSNPNFYTDEQFTIVTMDLFEAGAETTSNTLEFGFYYIIHNPNAQAKVQEEIDRVVGRSRLPTFADKPNMPYTEATLAEIQRMANVLPMTVRNPTEDFPIDGYVVKKNSIGFMNLYSVHMSKKFWGDPEKFRPERFLDEDGNLIPEKIQRVIPFGGGKRVCLGETLARATLFVYFTTLLQAFNFQKTRDPPKDNKEPVLTGFTLSPVPYTAKVTKR